MEDANGFHGQTLEGITVEPLQKAAFSWDGSPLPAYPEGQPEISVLRITVEPGARLPLHRHPAINAGVILRGEMRVTTQDGRELLARAGDGVIELVETWHHAANTASEPAEMVVFYAGVVGQELTIFAED